MEIQVNKEVPERNQTHPISNRSKWPISDNIKMILKQFWRAAGVLLINLAAVAAPFFLLWMLIQLSIDDNIILEAKKEIRHLLKEGTMVFASAVLLINAAIDFLFSKVVVSKTILVLIFCGALIPFLFATLAYCYYVLHKSAGEDYRQIIFIQEIVVAYSIVFFLIVKTYFFVLQERQNVR